MGASSLRVLSARVPGAYLVLVVFVALTAALGPATAATTGSQRFGSGPRAPAASRRALLFRAVLDLRARDLDGTLWTHERLRGRITLIDFWATWCAPCRREMPYLKRARARYGSRFRILGVSLDTMSGARLRSWLSRQQVGWPQIHAAGGYDDDIAVAFGIDRLPTNLLLDRQGRLRAVDVRGGHLFDEIDRLLAEDSTR